MTQNTANTSRINLFLNIVSRISSACLWEHLESIEILSVRKRSQKQHMETNGSWTRVASVNSCKGLVLWLPTTDKGPGETFKLDFFWFSGVSPSQNRVYLQGPLLSFYGNAVFVL